MPRSIATTVENNFVNGLITEATALNFPEAAATETYNCVFLPKGDVKRRNGFDFEPDYQLITANRNEVVVNTFLWQNAAGSGDNNFVVLQVGSLLTLYKVGGASALSGNASLSTIDLTTFAPAGAPSPASVECQFAFGKGYLFVVHPTLNPFFLVYDPVALTFTAASIAIQTRDFDGVEEVGVTNDTRPASLFDSHKYNLFNQGWSVYDNGGLTDMTVVTGSTIIYPSGYSAGDPLATWTGSRSDFPSNSDVWWLYKDASNVLQPKLANADLRGNSPAPKGHYLLDAFNMDRATASGIVGLPVVSAGYQRPQAVAFFAGRVFYGGVNAQGFSNKVYFSQLVRGTKEFGYCYQQNDPTSEFSFDLLATDGGEVSILECGTIIKMVSMQNSLIIFASNGVWSISGSQGIGFSANDYSVRKISSTPAISSTSFVDIAGAPAWWNTDGIYTIGGNDTLGQVQVTSLTEKKIKKFFDDIPAGNKAYAKGYYNSLTKVVQWVYRSTEPVSISQRYEFDTILNLNVTTGAFYPWSVEGSAVALNSIVAVQGTASTTQTIPVTDALGVNVTDSLGNAVQSRDVKSQAIASVFKYLVSYVNSGSYKMTFAEASDLTFTDFVSHDSVGTDYESYLVSGYKVHGDAQKKFQANYLYLFCNNTNPSTLYLQAIWDYASSSLYGDYGSKQIVEWRNQDRKYRYRRLKIRGMGISLQFKLSSFSGKDFDVVGWSAFESGNATV